MVPSVGWPGNDISLFTKCIEIGNVMTHHGPRTESISLDATIYYIIIFIYIYIICTDSCCTLLNLHTQLRMHMDGVVLYMFGQACAGEKHTRRYHEGHLLLVLEKFRRRQFP